MENGLLGWVFNGISTQKGQFVATSEGNWHFSLLMIQAQNFKFILDCFVITKQYSRRLFSFSNTAIELTYCNVKFNKVYGSQE